MIREENDADLLFWCIKSTINDQKRPTRKSIRSAAYIRCVYNKFFFTRRGRQKMAKVGNRGIFMGHIIFSFDTACAGGWGVADFLTSLRLVLPIPQWLVNPFQVTVSWRERPLFKPFSFGARRLIYVFL